MQEIYKTCGTPNEADIAGYTKVDQTNEKYKMALMMYCSQKYQECQKTAWKEAMKNKKAEGGGDKPEGGKPGGGKGPTDEQKAKWTEMKVINKLS